MNVTRKVLYFVAIILLYCCKIFFLLYRNLTRFTFSVQGFLCVCIFFVSILNVYICSTLAILCLYRAVLLLQYNSNVKSTHTYHA